MTDHRTDHATTLLRIGATVPARPQPHAARLAIGGEDAEARLRAHLPTLTRAVMHRLADELPAHARLPREQLGGDIRDTVGRSLRLFARLLGERRPARPDELAPQRDSAAQHAEEGVPLDAILAAYGIGFEAGWSELSAGARPGDLPALREATLLLQRYQRQLTTAVSAAYLEARQVLDAHEQSGRHALFTALLAGEPLDRHAPAPRYAVLALSLEPLPDERRSDPRAPAATRRKVRRVREVLDRYAGQPALTALDAGGGTVLVPAAEPPEWAELRALVDALGPAAGLPVTAAADVATPAEVPETVARVREVAEVARRSGRPPGLYRLADVLLEYQLSRPGPARDELALLLRPLDANPDLLHTLRVFLRTGHDRRAAAAALHVHPNTVDYRLRRIRVLTGLSPACAADLPTLHAALVAMGA